MAVSRPKAFARRDAGFETLLHAESPVKLLNVTLNVLSATLKACRMAAAFWARSQLTHYSSLLSAAVQQPAERRRVQPSDSTGRRSVASKHLKH